MKKFIFGLIATVMFGSLSFGQQISRDVTDSKEIENVKSHILKFGDFYRYYDFNKIKFIFENNNSNYGVYIINKNDFNSSNATNEALTVAFENNMFKPVFFVKTTKKDKSNNILDYMNLEKKLFFQ